MSRTCSSCEDMGLLPVTLSCNSANPVLGDSMPPSGPHWYCTHKCIPIHRYTKLKQTFINHTYMCEINMTVFKGITIFLNKNFRFNSKIKSPISLSNC